MPDVNNPPSGGFQHGGWYWDPKIGEAKQYNRDTGFGAGTTLNIPGQKGFGERVSDETQAQSGFVAPRPTTKEQVSPFLNDFQTNAFNQDGAPEVKVQTREEIKAGLDKELALPDRPEVPKLLDTFTEKSTEAGLDVLQTDIDDLTAQAREIEAQKRIRTQAERDKPVATGVISGRVSQIERQESERLDVINREKAFKIDQYNSALGSIQMIMSFTQQDFDNASTSFNSQFTQGLAMINAVSGIEQSQKDDIQRARDNALATLQITMNAVTEGNVNFSDLSQDQQFNIAKLEAAAGLPVGFTSRLKMSPNDRLLNVNDKTGEALMIDANGNFKVVKTGMTISPKDPTDSAETAIAQRNIVEAFNQVKGSDGFVDPKDWGSVRQVWLSQGRKAVDFENNFKSYANPDHLKSYGIKEPTGF